MKFIVDELPEKITTCPFVYLDNTDPPTYCCKLDHYECIDTAHCDHLITIEDYLDIHSKYNLF